MAWKKSQQDGKGNSKDNVTVEQMVSIQKARKQHQDADRKAAAMKRKLPVSFDFSCVGVHSQVHGTHAFLAQARKDLIAAKYGSKEKAVVSGKDEMYFQHVFGNC